ncbi:hypothetical protein D3C80_1357230 [compost metagenome]
MDVVIDDLGGKALGVFLHALHQGRTGQAFDIAGPVVDFGGGGQLAASLQAGDQQGLQVGAGCIHGGGVAGRAGAEDDQARMFGFTHKTPHKSLSQKIMRAPIEPP